LANSEKNFAPKNVPKKPGEAETCKQRLLKLENIFNLALENTDGVFDVESIPHSSHIKFSDMPGGNLKTISTTAVR